MSCTTDKPCRAMHGIASQVPTAGSMTTSRTHMETVGIADAMHRLAQDAFDLLATGTADTSYLHVLDSLSVEKLAQEASTAVKALCRFADQPGNLAALEKELAFLNAVESERPGADTREMLDAVRSVVDEHVTQFRQVLQQTFDSQPSGIPSVIDVCRQRLKDLAIGQPSLLRLRKFAKLVDRLRELPEHESQLLPDLYGQIFAALTQAARSELDIALSELVTRKAAQALQCRRAHLESFLTALESTSARFKRQVTAIMEAFAEECKKSRSLQAELESSLAISLSGPNEDQVVVGCRTKSASTDIGELVSKLCRDFGTNLREQVTLHHSYLDAANSSIAALITEVPTQELIDVFRNTFNSFLSEAHGLFEAIRGVGEDVCAYRLWQRAAPTCFTSALGTYRFGIAPVEFTIVQLPIAESAADEETRHKLVEDFQTLARGCHIVDGAPGSEIMVTRVLSGHLIGLEESNDCLLQRYVESDQVHHAPHLALFFADSPFGQVIPAAVQLAAQLRPLMQGNQEYDDK